MMDLALEAWVSGLIELTKLRWMLGAGRRWAPGQRLKLIFTGYNGTRNTGSDVRVEEMLRQIRHVLGADRVSFSVLTQNFDLTRGYFDQTTQLRLPDIFPPMLYREVPKYDGVVACEGSMFKSKFSNALTTMMIGSLAIASAENKLSVGYGAEAGEMDPLLAKMCRRYCGQSLIITRNQESVSALGELGIPSELGTDTAWTFDPPGPEYGLDQLRKNGWDGRSQVLAVCPINPFWWPVKATLLKYLGRSLTGAYADSHYRSVYFHHSGSDVTQAYDRYITAMSKAVENARSARGIFPVLVALEALDTRACERMSERLGGAPIFTSYDHNMYEMVGILRSCHMMVSSRYHAIVTTMPSLLPSAGVSMDERIRNLMNERGHRHLLVSVDDPELEDRLVLIIERLQEERDAIRDSIGSTVARNLKTMARMGVYFERHVQQRYPEFPIRSGLRSWEEYLPPLSPMLQGLLESYEGSAVPGAGRGAAAGGVVSLAE